MNKWRVYNTHPHGLTHKENFKGDLIEIKAGDYVLMDYEDAVQFKGQYVPMVLDAQEVQDPRSYKCIKIEPDDKKIEAIVETKLRYVCHFDGKEFESKDLLEAYVDANFSDYIIKDENLDKEIEESKKNKRGK